MALAAVWGFFGLSGSLMLESDSFWTPSAVAFAALASYFVLAFLAFFLKTLAFFAFFGQGSFFFHLGLLAAPLALVTSLVTMDALTPALVRVVGRTIAGLAKPDLSCSY